MNACTEFSDPLLGGGHVREHLTATSRYRQSDQLGEPRAEAAAQPTQLIDVLSINCTQLTKDRCHAILQHAQLHSIAIVCLQETRHSTPAAQPPPWAVKLARDFGYRVAFSCPSKAQGGTAIFHRLHGRVSTYTTEDHRVTAITTNGLTVLSLYGPAAAPDYEWLTSQIAWACDTNRTWVCAGDLNWRADYEPLVAELSQAEAIVTTAAGTRITRCFSSNDCRHISADATPLPGISHHRAIRYSLEVPAVHLAPPQQKTRIRHTADYQWTASKPSEAPLQAARDEAVAATLDLPAGTLDQRWKKWHATAEQFLIAAAGSDLAVVSRKAERPKGPCTEGGIPCRPTAPGAAHRHGQTIRMRRLLRLHRCFVEALRHSAHMSHQHLRQWHIAIDENAIAEDARQHQLYTQAITTLDQAISIEARSTQDAKTKLWKKQLARHTTRVKAASCITKPCTTPDFTPAQMTKQWAEVWTPPSSSQTADAWAAYARDYPNAPATDAPVTEWPDYMDFKGAILATNGAAGLDGWSASELKAIARWWPDHADALWDLFSESSASASDVASTFATAETISKNHYAALSTWRVTGIPKRKPDESRPISVASTLVRALHRTFYTTWKHLLQFDGQYAGRSATTVTSTIAQYLATNAKTGAEMDLTKAFDSVQHTVADRALSNAGIPRRAIDMLRCAWAAPRICTVQGQPDDAWIRPGRGIPQGCSMSGAILCAILAPWSTAIPAVSGCRTMAFLDDRTLLADADNLGIATGQLDAALSFTATFDTACGLAENHAKRQRWTAGDHQSTEHLGLIACHSDPALGRQPRDNWDSVREAIGRLQRIPSTIITRPALASVFVRPKLEWAAPLTDPCPEELVRLLFLALVKPKATWWCQNRWWMQHTPLHPRFGPAIRTLSIASGIARHHSAHIDDSCQRAAQVLGLEVTDFHLDRGPILTTSADDDYRVLQAVRQIRAVDSNSGSLPARRFFANSPAAQHTLRTIARTRLAAAIVPTRHDSEGFQRIDLEAASHSAFTSWAKKLPDADRRLLAIWRSGAISTPARRRLTVCHLCQADGRENASARHLWADCPALSLQRATISRAHRLAPDFWSSQPRVTAKSGWITTDAATDPARRATFLKAACPMGLHVMQHSLLTTAHRDRHVG